MARAPEVVFVAITFADDTLGVMQFVTQEFARNDAGQERIRWQRPSTSENIDAEIARSSWDAGKLPIKGWRFMPFGLAELPTQDRTYRNAWVDRAGKIEHDMERAREIHRQLLRQARGPLLAELDAQYLLADEAGDAVAKADVAATKQVLRDITDDARIDAAKTVDDLKLVTVAAVVTDLASPAALALSVER